MRRDPLERSDARHQLQSTSCADWTVRIGAEDHTAILSLQEWMSKTYELQSSMPIACGYITHSRGMELFTDMISEAYG